MLTQNKSHISLQLPTDLVSAFETVGAALGQGRDWVMLQALKQYLEREGEDIFRDLEGLAELDQGEGTDLDDVLNQASAIVDAAEVRRTNQVG